MIWFLLQRRWPFTDVQCILALALEGFDSQAWQALLPCGINFSSLKASVRPVGEKKTPFQQTLTKVFHPRALASGISTKHPKSKWVFDKSSFHSKIFLCLHLAEQIWGSWKKEQIEIATVVILRRGSSVHTHTPLPCLRFWHHTIYTRHNSR